MEEFGEKFPHPHNAYLEILLDAGVIGLLIVVPFYLVVLWHSLSLFKDSRSGMFIAAGGVTAALTVALLAADRQPDVLSPRGIGRYVVRHRADGACFRGAAQGACGRSAGPRGGSPAVRVRLRPVPLVRPAVARVRATASAAHRASLKNLNLDPFLWKAAA